MSIIIVNHQSPWYVLPELVTHKIRLCRRCVAERRGCGLWIVVGGPVWSGLVCGSETAGLWVTFEDVLQAFYLFHSLAKIGPWRIIALDSIYDSVATSVHGAFITTNMLLIRPSYRSCFFTPQLLSTFLTSTHGIAGINV